MNGMYQQGGFASQSQPAFGQSKQQYKPAGFVQSYYKGGISKQNAGPVISHTGYQASQQQSFTPSAVSAFGYQQQQHQQPQQRATAGMSIGQSYQQQPVISSAGYISGQSYYPKAAAHQQVMSSFAAQKPFAQQQKFASAWNQNVQQFQSQPVIAHAGGYQAGSQSGAQFGQFGQAGQSNRF